MELNIPIDKGPQLFPSLNAESSCVCVCVFAYSVFGGVVVLYITTGKYKGELWDKMGAWAHSLILEY